MARRPFRPHSTSLLAAGVIAVTALSAAGCRPVAGSTAPRPATSPNATAGGAAPASAGPTPRRAPRPYAQVITNKAVTDSGGITVHRVDDRWFFEVPDSLTARDFLLVSRIASVPTNFDGFISAGTAIEERLVRWERSPDRLILRTIGTSAFADDSLPIARSVGVNNLGAILAAFPIQATTKDSASVVVDVTDFFGGDTPGIAGLSAAQRRQYAVRRLDPARSFINTARSFPMNVEVRHTQTFEAGEPPADRSSGTISLEMRQSLVLLPKSPMRPRYADARVGFFSVSRVNYGLDDLKAASQQFIQRWRLEPKDPAAYARGELVEPVKPIVYYLDPATPARWRPYVKAGVEEWQRVFEKAGFKNAVMAKEPPSATEDPTWDPEDIRYSVVRWTASLTRNAVGPSTADPRTGEIIESDITWYHNHLRSYRNRLLVETGAANPAARTLDIPEELMGETLKQVIAHEVGHAIGLPHNMVASSFFAVDSLRSPAFVRRYGVSATIMDYARQNYVAQPGDGLAPLDFIRRVGPFDDFVINWGYRALPDAATPESERATLDAWIAAERGPMGYRYVPQYLSSIDPRAQTEDIGDDPVRASTFAIANLQRVVPNLVAWTTKPGENYDELAELYGETVGMWSRYMGHVATVVGGMEVDAKKASQAGAVYRVVPRARQEAALRFLGDNVVRTPEWLLPADVRALIGPTVGASLMNAQAGLVTGLLSAQRLARMSDAGQLDAARAYPVSAYLADMRRIVWSDATPDGALRTMQRVYVDRLGVLVEPPAGPAGPTVIAGGAGGAGPGIPPLLGPVNVQRSDLPALARSELQAIRESARRAAGGASGVTRAHWLDVAERVTAILEPAR